MFGYQTSKVHKFHKKGRQEEDIAVIQTSRNPQDIHKSQAGCYVAITRHTKSFLLVTLTKDDIISQWIIRAKSFSPLTI